MKGLDFALWFEPTVTARKKSRFQRLFLKGNLCSDGVGKATVHINAWKISNEDTLDFGILFEVPDSEFTLNLYVPEKEGSFKFESIASKLFEKNILWSFFNDVAEKASFGCSDSLFVRLKKDNENFIILDLPIHTDSNKPYKTESFGPGTIVKISDLYDRFQARSNNSQIIHAAKFLKPKKIYLRFRITGQFIKNSFSNRMENSIIENLVSTITLFDFSLNRVRRLPEVFYSDGRIFDRFPELERLDFFLMMEAKEELRVAQRAHDVVQILEKDKWKGYFDQGQINFKDQILLYHWKHLKKCPEKPLNEFSIFLKTRKSRWNWVALLIAICLAIFTSSLGSVLWDLIKFFFPSVKRILN